MDCTECGACCLHQEIPLREEDIIDDEFVCEMDDGVRYLGKVNGHCVFFNPETRMCTNYEERPTVCRVFPKGSPECLSIMAWADSIGWFGRHQRSLSPYDYTNEEMEEVSLPG